MSNPHTPFDPDPEPEHEHPAPYEFDGARDVQITGATIARPPDVEEDDLWDPRARAWVSRDGGGCLFLSGVIVGVILGSLLGIFIASHASAAPRSAAEPVIPAVALTRDSVVVGHLPVRATSGNLAERPSGAPRSGMLVEVLEADAGRVAPAPAGGVGAPITEPDASMSGTATWCAPTPKHCQRWGGNAHLGAMGSFRYGDGPYQVTVKYGGRTTSVLIVSYCACPQTLIDLSPAAFAELAPLSLGRIPVTVTIPSGPGPTPPPTDTEP